MRTIKTNAGDTWDSAAWRIWGDGADKEQMEALIAANLEHINTAVFDANVELNIPDTVETPIVSVPPWRR